MHDDAAGELGRELAHELGAGAFGVVHVQGEPEDDLGLWAAGLAVELLDDLGDEQASVFTIDGDLDEPGGGSDAGDPVGEGQAGSLVTEIDGEDSHGGFYERCGSGVGSVAPLGGRYPTLDSHRAGLLFHAICELDRQGAKGSSEEFLRLVGCAPLSQGRGRSVEDGDDTSMVASLATSLIMVSHRDCSVLG